MQQAGLPEDIARNYVEMGNAMDSGIMTEDYFKQGKGPTGKVKLDDFAREFAAVYNAATPVQKNKINTFTFIPRNMITTNRKVIDRKYLNNAMDYTGYRKLVDDLLLEGKVTGPQQSESLAHYTKLNVQRMQRIDKTVQLLPEAVATLRRPSTSHRPGW